MANKKSLPDEVEFPCSYCCSPMKFDKQIFLKGGMVCCKKCGMKVMFKPHPNAGRKKVNLKKWRGANLFSCESGHDKSASGIL